ncbi:hypothetical protein [Duganella radicis]|uniref:Uncharacterized protein n=1 Tax=Duganella radicis TaxID=551988 RepID=A0A6L6PGY9_9BURK|nr:hypothetical protein [Duganella radicis]MTV38328.1 hypothetical protein [Duganella radicis]
MDEREAKEKIRAAIRESKYVWRTVRGISADTGITEETVLQILETADGFLRAYRRNPLGQTLYSTTEKYRRDATWKQKILDAITNKVGV